MNNLSYSLKVWLTSVVVAPLLVYLVSYFAGYTHFFNVFEWLLAFGFLLSLPSFLLFLFLVIFLSTKKWEPVLKQYLLTICGCVLTVAPIYLLFGREKTSLLVMFCYLVPCIAGIKYYRLPCKTMSPEEQHHDKAGN